MSIQPFFTFDFDQVILPRRALIANLDGLHPTLVAASTSGKVCMFSPFEMSTSKAGSAGTPSLDAGSSTSDPRVRYLNVNRDITALISAEIPPPSPSEAKSLLGVPAAVTTKSSTSLASSLPVEPSSDKGSKHQGSALLIGTSCAILSYDAASNKDLFYCDVNDGVYAICFGGTGSQGKLALCGGNGNIIGYNRSGTEKFYTATAQRCSALVLYDVDLDGTNEILWASDECKLAYFKDEKVYHERQTPSPVICLLPLMSDLCAYALQSGEVGVWRGTNSKPLWAKTQRGGVADLAVFDIDRDDVPELIIGWQSGELEACSITTGETLVQLPKMVSIAALAVGDIRQAGLPQLIVLDTRGRVCGYMSITTGSVLSQLTAQAHEEVSLTALLEQRDSLEEELARLTEAIQHIKGGDNDTSLPPPSTEVHANVFPDLKKGGLCLSLSVTQNCSILGVVIESPLLLGADGAKVVMCTQPESDFQTILKPKDDMGTTISVKAFVAVSAIAKHAHCHETQVIVPRFSMYTHSKTALTQPTGHVILRITLTPSRIAEWINANFVLASPLETHPRVSSVEAWFTSLREPDSPLSINYTGGMLTIWTDNIELAGNIVGGIGEFLGIKDQESTAEFPAVFAQFNEILQKVEAFNATRLKMTGDIADATQTIKALIIRAEDARILGKIPKMCSFYRELVDQNRELLGEYLKRSRNHEELLSTLKLVHNFIQKGAKLRLGTPQQLVISECRTALKANNFNRVINILRRGGSD